MRKYLTASLSACLVSASFVGCGEKSQEVQVSEQLDELLAQISLLKYADAPLENNELEYTLGKEVKGVKVPGSPEFEAIYLDQALALLPQAEEIKKNGTELQKQSANAIIGSIRTEQAAYLISEAERAFQASSTEVVALRNKLEVLREIQALNRAVAGDGSELIETYQSGLGAADIAGINGLQEQASEAASKASQASQDLEKYNQQIDDLREKVAEYEELELKLTGQARSAQSTEKFDKLDQATAAAKEAELAQAEAAKFEIDAWIAERMANLAEFKRQQLAGDKQSDADGLMAKIDGFLAEASEETNIPDSSDTYADFVKVIAQAKATSGGNETKGAAFLLGMSEYVTAAVNDADQRRLLVAAMDKRVSNYLGTIGLLEMKIAQIKLDRQRVADKLAKIEGDRQAVLEEFAAEFAEHDAMVQAAGFDRMAEALDAIKLAEEAVKSSGGNKDMELMSVYMLHARALQQQGVSAQLYQTALASIAAAGPDLLGSGLHGTLASRVDEMSQLLQGARVAAGDLQTAAMQPMASLDLNAETNRGQIASRQLELYESLIASLGQGGDSSPAPADEEPAAP